MTSDTLLLCCLGLAFAGITSFYIAWNALTFQENEEQEYDFHDLAFYGGKLCAIKNFFRGISSPVTGRHKALFGPALSLIFAIILQLGALYLYTLSGK